ncbi:hypothetical protein HPP92_023978 [Vanilla planifolia]|uniref:Uncharacterized protein n=1 Tax=Vanilla planifolia TaxID=51239 RepID=A0A835UCI2_VANPL|nr:hypothetical protein HPP92_023978 [Vanilla planifolia]
MVIAAALPVHFFSSPIISFSKPSLSRLRSPPIAFTGWLPFPTSKTSPMHLVVQLCSLRSPAVAAVAATPAVFSVSKEQPVLGESDSSADGLDVVSASIRNVAVFLASAALSFSLLLTDASSASAFVVTTPRKLQSDELATVRLFQENTPSVVYITNLAVRQDAFTLDVLEVPQGSGSGFVWDKQGHIVTNYHVIRGASDLRVTLADQSTYEAKIVGFDQDKDVAVLRISAPKDKLRPIPVGVSADLLVGQKVYAIGNPFGLDHTLTTGVISGLRREISSAATGRPIQDVIQTDAAINPGNSGGPLLDSSGNLIGINTAIYSPSGASSGVGFSIPVDTVGGIVEQLVKFGKVTRPILGIKFAPDQSVEQLGVSGVLVLDAPPNGPAGKAGLQPTKRDTYGRLILGDIITSVNGKKVANGSDLYRILDQCKVGDTGVMWKEKYRNPFGAGGRHEEIEMSELDVIVMAVVFVDRIVVPRREIAVRNAKEELWPRGIFGLMSDEQAEAYCEEGNLEGFARLSKATRDLSLTSLDIVAQIMRPQILSRIISEIIPHHQCYSINSKEILQHRKILQELVNDLENLNLLSSGKIDGMSSSSTRLSKQNQNDPLTTPHSDMLVTGRGKIRTKSSERTHGKDAELVFFSAMKMNSCKTFQTSLASAEDFNINIKAVKHYFPSPALYCVEAPPVIGHVSHVSFPEPNEFYVDSSCKGSSTSKATNYVHISAGLMDKFMELARSNTVKDFETCGILGASLKNNTYYITTLVMPKQESTSNTCQALSEEEIHAILAGESLYPAGWIHTHPSQTCFLSSIDLHTQYSYQVMLPEAVAIVMAPTDPERKSGIFRLSDPGGIDVLRHCKERGFHSHPETEDGGPIYETCSDVYVDPSLRFEVFDMRLQSVD